MPTPMIKKFAQITKTDVEKRMVYGYASTEALDSQGDVVSREAIEKALPDYMQFANIREMHQLQAAGVAKTANMDEKGLYLAVKVVDESAWQKVKEGVYKGFSIGGYELQRLGNVISEMVLTEISLVDRPANPEALIEIFRADTGAKLDQAPQTVLDEKTKPDREIEKTEQPASAGFFTPAAIEKAGAKHSKATKEELAAIREALASCAEKLAAFVGEPDGDEAKKAEEVPEEEAEHEEPDGDESAAKPEEKPEAEEADDVEEKPAPERKKAALVEMAKAQEIAKALQAVESENTLLKSELATLKKRVLALEAEPEAPKGFVKAVVVAKTADNEDPPENEPKTAQEAIKKAFANPLPMIAR